MESVVFGAGCAGAGFVPPGVLDGLLHPIAAATAHAANTTHRTFVFDFISVPFRMTHFEEGENTNFKTTCDVSQGYDGLATTAARGGLEPFFANSPAAGA